VKFSQAKTNAIKVVIVFVIPLRLPLMSKFVSATVSHGAQTRKSTRRTQPKKAGIDYARFSHTTHFTQQKLACDSCHKFPTANSTEVRKDDSVFDDVAEFPEHSSCLNCHRQQFFARERPAPSICSNCHPKVTPQDTARFLFPSLGDVSDSTKLRRQGLSEFAINFPHDKHIDVVGIKTPANRSPFVAVAWKQDPAAANKEPKSCPVCHQTYLPQGDSDQEYVTTPPKNLDDGFWLKKGTFKTSPNSHTVCFSCHNVDAGLEPAPSNCNACHKLSQPAVAKADSDPKLVKTIGVTDITTLTIWPKRMSSGTFRHEGGEHPNLNCINCHNVATMVITDKKSLKVPVSSCGGAEGCHITATVDDGGILNYEVDEKKKSASFACTKCHLSFGNMSLPPSHLEAISKLKKS